jgi:hypothetical protein
MRVLCSVTALLFAALAGCLAEPPCANLETGQAAYQRGDYAFATDQLAIAAERGCVAAHTLLGHIHRDGHGDTGRSDAETHYLQAARQGDCTAQLSLARMYHLRDSKSRSKKDALGWYEAAAKNGSSWAQLALASFFDQGTLVQRDNVQAFYWFSVLAARPVEITDRTSWALQEVAIRSLVAIRNRMTADQFIDAMDLVEEQMVDPMGCGNG